MRRNSGKSSSITRCRCHSRITHPLIGASLAALAIPIFSSAAYSQTEDKSASSALEEITVTARRRSENIQSVPIAISVVTREKLQDNHVQTLTDLQNLVPSLAVNSRLTRDSINVSIRGQGTNGTSGLPGVIAYLNEVPLPTDNQGNLAGGPGLLFDLEDVQVLKGPQGTLFGRNSVGGALLLQSARPKNEFGGNIQMGFGNYSNREIDGAVNIPIVSDRILTRFAFNGVWRDGFTKIRSDSGHPQGTDGDNRDYWSARGTVTVFLGANIKNDTILTYSKYGGHGSPNILTDVAAGGSPALVSFLAQQQQLGIRTVIPMDGQPVSSGKNVALNNITTIELGDDISFRNIFGYDKATLTIQGDADGTTLPLFQFPSSPRRQAISQYSVEPQLQGKSIGGNLDWIIGAFYLKQPAPAGYVLQTAQLFGFPFDSEYRQSALSRAIYGQGSYDLSVIKGGLGLTAGVRYTWDKVSFSQRGLTVGAICVTPRVNCDVTTSATQKNKALTWTFALDYQLSPDTLLYITERKGYRAGGVNLGGPAFGPEFIFDTEAGIKSTWNVGGVQVRTNAAVYYQNYKDIQVQQFTLVGNGFANITSNAAAADIWGAEFELQARITKHLQIGGSLDHIKLRYKKIEPGVNAAVLNASRTGGRPRYKYSLNGRYSLPLAAELGDISLQGSWAWQDRTEDQIGRAGVIRSYGVLNLAVNWDEIGGSRFDGSVFVTNLTKQVYEVGGFAANDFLGFTSGRFGEPRMFGARLRYRFGAR